MELRRRAALRNLPDVLLPGVDGAHPLHRRLPPDARRRDVRGARFDAAPVVRHARRPAGPPDPPLGRARVRRRHRRAHAPHLLHRRVPQAARAQLGDRLHPVHPRDGRGLHRLLASRRPAVRQRPAHHRRHGQGHPADRHVDLVPALRRRVPRRPDRRAPVHAAHPAAARDPRRSARRAPDAHGHQQAHAVRRRPGARTATSSATR